MKLIYIHEYLLDGKSFIQMIMIIVDLL